MDEKKQVSGIPTDAIIDVQISGNFYLRLHQLLIYHSRQKSLEDYPKALASLKAGEPKDEFEYHLLTILTVLTSVEAAASAQGKIKTADLPSNPSA